MRIEQADAVEQPAYTMLRPPSITTVAPVMRLASSDSRKATTDATSSGRPTAPSGGSRVADAPAVSRTVPTTGAVSGVSTSPGQTQLTRMRLGPDCAARRRASERVPPLAAAQLRADPA